MASPAIYPKAIRDNDLIFLALSFFDSAESDPVIRNKIEEGLLVLLWDTRTLAEFGYVESPLAEPIYMIGQYSWST